MNLEEKNKLKRKKEPLTNEEWFTYFFFPFQNRKGLNTNTFNELEEKRFSKFNFENKIKESKRVRFYGLLFYILLTVLIIIILKW